MSNSSAVRWWGRIRGTGSLEMKNSPVERTEKGLWDKKNNRWVFTFAKEEYLKQCNKRRMQRSSLIKEVVEAKHEFIRCANCDSSLSREYAKKCSTFVDEAKCVVCKETLLSKDAQELLTKLWKEGEADYEAYRKAHPKVDGEFCPVLPVKSSFEWQQVLPKQDKKKPKQTTAKKKKWWNLW